MRRWMMTGLCLFSLSSGLWAAEHGKPAWATIERALGAQQKRILDAVKEGRLDKDSAKPLKKKVMAGFHLLHQLQSENHTMRLPDDQIAKVTALCDEARKAIDEVLGPAS